MGGNDSVASWRWHRHIDEIKRLRTALRKVQEDRDELAQRCKKLEDKLTRTERMLERCERIFGFHVPEIQEEPFS